MLSLALAAYGVALTRQWSMPLATRQWSKTYIAPLGFGQTELQCKRPGWSDAASAVHLGEAVVQVPNAASTAEIEQLVAISSDIAEDERAQCVEGAVRLHVPSRLPAADASVCDTILRRMLDFVDAEFPELVADLYGDSTLKELHEEAPFYLVAACDRHQQLRLAGGNPPPVISGLISLDVPSPSVMHLWLPQAAPSRRTALPSSRPSTSTRR